MPIYVIDWTFNQNFYPLKIHLYLYNSNLVFFIPSGNLFQTWTLQSGAMCKNLRDKLEYKLFQTWTLWSVVTCVCVQCYHMMNLNTCTWHHAAGTMFEINFQVGWNIFGFKSNFQISKHDLRFQIDSNGFSKDRSFGQ